MTVFKNLKIKGEVTDLACDNGIITHIGKLDADGIDCHGLTAYAGLIDIHTHGMGGLDTMDGQLSSLATLYAEAGTTSFCPTTMTAPLSEVQALLDIPSPDCGAKMRGLHLEGPFISKQYPGAQNKDCIISPAEAQASLDAAAIITLAPELDGAIELIKSSEAKICIGHTSADYDTACRAADAGACCVSHIFNAMPPLHHREPSVVGAAFDKNMYVQLICDGIHIHPSVVRMLYSLFGSDRMILISDSVRACGLPDGEYELGGQMITVKNKIARTESGALAGSTFTLLDCVKSAVAMGIPESEAFRMASETPAKMLGLNCGRLDIGYECDFILLDSSLSLCGVVIDGQLQK